MNVILGISAAAGIGVGKAFILPEERKREIPKHKIKTEQIDSEWKRFEEAKSSGNNQRPPGKCRFKCHTKRNY